MVGKRESRASGAQPQLEPSPGPTSAESLTSRFVRSFGWAAVARGTQQVVALLSIAVLARLIAPSAFGVMAMAMLFINFASAFGEFVISDAVVQKPEIEGDTLSSLFWANMAIGLAMTLGLVAIAPAAAEFFRERLVAAILPPLAWTFLITAASNIQRALFYREMDLRKLSLAQCVANLVGLAVAVVLAARGAAVWSLVVSSLATRVLDGALMWVLHPWRPRFCLRWADVRQVASFGLNLSGYGIVDYFSKNGANLVVGRFLGSAQLGFYQNAYALIFYPQQVVAALVSSVSLAPLSKVQRDDERFRAGLLKLSAFTALLLAPLMLGLLVTSDLVVAIVLGPKWSASAPVVSILAIGGLLQMLSASTLPTFIAKGRTDLLFRWSLVSGALNLAAFLAGARWGIQGVAAGYVLVSAALLVPLLRSALGLVGMRVRSYLRSLAPLVGIALGMAACVALWRLALAAAGAGGVWLAFGTSVPLGVAAYCLLGYWIWPDALRNLVEDFGSVHVAGLRHIARFVLRWREAT